MSRGNRTAGETGMPAAFSVLENQLGNTTLHGMYYGYDAGNPADPTPLSGWTSANNSTVLMGHEFGDNTQWSYFAGGTNFANWNTWVGAAAGRSFSYSCPLMAATNVGDYAGLNAGTYDTYFTQLGQALQAQPNLRNAVFRLGWEFNGNTFPWQIPANSTDAQLTAYKNGYNRAAGLIKTGCPTVKFEWCPNAHLDNANRLLADMYPGDTYVDYVGLAVYDYYLPGGTPTAVQRYDYLVTGTNGLADQWRLAQAVGKPVAFTEWGLWPTSNLSGGGDRPAFVNLMLDWMLDHRAAYTVYNNVSATQDHRLDQYPNAKAAYVARLGTGRLVAPALP